MMNVLCILHSKRFWGPSETACYRESLGCNSSLTACFSILERRSNLNEFQLELYYGYQMNVPIKVLVLTYNQQLMTRFGPIIVMPNLLSIITYHGYGPTVLSSKFK